MCWVYIYNKVHVNVVYNIYIIKIIYIICLTSLTAKIS